MTKLGYKGKDAKTQAEAQKATTQAVQQSGQATQAHLREANANLEVLSNKAKLDAESEELRMRQHEYLSRNEAKAEEDIMRKDTFSGMFKGGMDALGKGDRGTSAPKAPAETEYTPPKR
jgi:multidrug efflux pump subunit AcrA (membrane-fusion protein)